MPKIKSSKTRVKSDEPRVKMSENLMKIKFYYIIISYWWCSALRTDFQVKFIKQKRERDREEKKGTEKRTNKTTIFDHKLLSANRNSKLKKFSTMRCV